MQTEFPHYLEAIKTVEKKTIDCAEAMKLHAVLDMVTKAIQCFLLVSLFILTMRFQYIVQNLPCREMQLYLQEIGDTPIPCNLIEERLIGIESTWYV